jgi:hypothetical protein
MEKSSAAAAPSVITGMMTARFDMFSMAPLARVDDSNKRL